MGAKTSVAESCIEFPSCPRRRSNCLDHAEYAALGFSVSQWRQVELVWGLVSGSATRLQPAEPRSLFREGADGADCLLAASLKGNGSPENETDALVSQEFALAGFFECRMILPQVHLR